MICKYPYTDTHCIHNPHECHQEIDQVRLHNFLLHKLSLSLSKFYMRLWQSKRPQFEYILVNITQVSFTLLNFLYKDNDWPCNCVIWSVHEHITHLSSALQHCQVHSVLAHISHIIWNSRSWIIEIIGHGVEHSPSVLHAPVCGIHVNEPTTH